jgi:hypothetical protein
MFIMAYDLMLMLGPLIAVRCVEVYAFRFR